MKIEEKQIEKLKDIPCSFIELLEIVNIGLGLCSIDMYHQMGIPHSDLADIHKSVQKILNKD